MDAVIRAHASLSPHAPERRLIAGGGTDEVVWLASPRLAALDTLNVAEWPARFRRIWVLAPHPDDEVLGLGGTLARLATMGADVRIVSATNGEASHPGSTRWTRARLATARPMELRHALERLDVAASIVPLGLPDGRIDASREPLLAALAETVDERDLLLATCRFDGHPDHEACGEVADLARQLTGATLYEYPVWMWHWAAPDEHVIPWDRARRLPLSDAIVDRKRRAIDAFASQVMPDGDHPPVLAPHVLPRFLRPFELVFA